MSLLMDFLLKFWDGMQRSQSGGRCPPIVSRQVSSVGLQDVVVETLRSIAELMIWGDQHDQQFFE